MKLRVYRTWNWELACSPFEVRYGGDNPMKLVSTDVLQYLDGKEWKDVEIFEEPKPEHPKTKREREHREKMQKEWGHVLEGMKHKQPFKEHIELYNDCKGL